MSLDGIGFFDNINSADSCFFRDNRLSGALQKKVNTSAFKRFSLRENAPAQRENELNFTIHTDQNFNGTQTAQGSTTISTSDNRVTFTGGVSGSVKNTPGEEPNGNISIDASVKIKW